MPKRAERRHHEERVKVKFKKVAKQLAGKVDNWVGKWEIKWKDGKVVSRQHSIDNTGAVKRMQYIEKTAVKMAHHPRHQCYICRHREEEMRKIRETEVERKAPMIIDD